MSLLALPAHHWLGVQAARENRSSQLVIRRGEASALRYGDDSGFDLHCGACGSLLASTMASANAIRGRIASGGVVGPTILTVGAPFYPPNGTPVYARPIYRADHLPSAEITSTPAAVTRVTEQAADGANGVKLFTGADLQRARESLRRHRRWILRAGTTN